MRLDALLEGTGCSRGERGETEITGLSYDSRTLKQGDLFVALRGCRTDGHRY